MNRLVAMGTLATGLLGTLACVAAMLLAIAGLAGAGASVGMAGMSGQRDMASMEGSGVVGFQLDHGPLILVLSIAAVVTALALRSWVAALSALVTGAVLYWGMYGQDRLAVMYASIALGLAVWAVAVVWAVQRPVRMRRAAPM